MNFGTAELTRKEYRDMATVGTEPLRQIQPHPGADITLLILCQPGLWFYD